VPELPEVEVIRRDLQREIEGKRIKAVEVLLMRTIRRHPNKKHFMSKLEDTKVRRIDRKGKYLLLRLDSGDVLVTHLGMSGRLLREKNAKTQRDKHCHVVITFTQGGDLRFVDPRQFGEMFVTPGNELGHIDELAHLGVDPLEEPLSWRTFHDILVAKKTRLKALLMNQEVFAGIGNIYSDEILWAAGICYDRQSDTVTSQEARRLYRAMHETLQDAVRHRGTSAEDEQYVDLFGKIGDFQTQLKVYQREGEPCRRCRAPIQRAKFQGRSTFFCPNCQT
jgi:formamidopyrimidine-DNA glycosylase